MGLIGAAPAVLQTVVTGGGVPGTVVTGGGVPGTAVVTAPVIAAPAMMAMSAMLPGVALGILKAIFIGNCSCSCGVLSFNRYAQLG